MDLSNYKNKLEDLKAAHKYVPNKLIMLYILFGLHQALFIGVIVFHSIVDPESLEKFFPLGIYVTLYILSFLFLHTKSISLSFTLPIVIL